MVALSMWVTNTSPERAARDAASDGDTPARDAEGQSAHLDTDGPRKPCTASYDSLSALRYAQVAALAPSQMCSSNPHLPGFRRSPPGHLRWAADTLDALPASGAENFGV